MAVAAASRKPVPLPSLGAVIQSPQGFCTGRMAGRWLLVAAAAAGSAAGYDMGPTYDMDYAGRDCAWTYCPPNSGDALEERCCLKNSVPGESQSPHWTGLAPRAVTGPDNKTLSPLCATPKPPPPAPPSPYPGKAWWAPRIHNSPGCLHDGGWHDIAGALTFKGTHHVFQGCPASSGWHHAASTDLVHWEDRGIHLVAVEEEHNGMHSVSPPCSGFVAVDDNGTVCAGFRQCGSDKGVYGGHPWDVPLELRCATNDDLTAWTAPIWLYDVFYYRALPYDPVRPWKDLDGKWYSTISTDGCNGTTKAVPCGAGGRLDLWRSDKLRGPGSNWEYIGPMFTTNRTTHINAISREFVTSGYFGGIPGDPDPAGATRVVTQNNGGPSFWVGKQQNGSPFVVDWAVNTSAGYLDYGSFTMARTLGADPNQVTVKGRRVIVGWIGGTPASQSLARDLTLSPSKILLQQFVPELKMLRQEPPTTLSAASPKTAGSLQAEIVATFSVTAAAGNVFEPFGVYVFGSPDGSEQARLEVACTPACTASVMGGGTHTAPLLPLVHTPVPGEGMQLSLHAILDHSIIEAIFNNRTAFAVTQVNPSQTNCTAIGLYGLEQPGVTGSAQVWLLAAANNL